nr:hypothetical protein [uncultured Dyadobacter sp.]
MDLSKHQADQVACNEIRRFPIMTDYRPYDALVQAFEQLQFTCA